MNAAVITFEDLEAQEKALLEQEAGLDHQVGKMTEELKGAQDNLMAVRGAVLQVRAQKQFLQQKATAEAQASPAAPAKKKDKRRRARVKGKDEETPVVTDTVTAPAALSA